ncbi:hypothetical protein ACROYT_G020450 [Oculina patagonica]
MVSLTRRKWRWIGHVLRKDSGDVAKEGLFWTPEGKRARGRPRTTWRRSAEKELTVSLSVEESSEENQEDLPPSLKYQDKLTNCNSR